MIIALILTLCFAGPAFSARISGADETVDMSSMPDAPDEANIEEPAETTPEPPGREPDMERQTDSPGQDRAETRAASKPIRVDKSQKYVTLDFDNVEIGVLVKFVSELTGKKIGVVTGFTGQKYVEGDASLKYPKIKNAKSVVFDNVSLAVAALINKSIDVIVMDDVVAQKVSSVAANKKAIKTIEVPLTVEKYAIAINKKNTELKNKVDKALKELIADGTVKKLLAKWEIR